MAFFELEDWEIDYIRKGLKGHELKFYRDMLTTDNVGYVRSCEIISVFVYSEINKKVLDRLERLRLVTTRSTGFDHIDIDACKKKNIAVCNVPFYGENTVAE